MAPMNLKVPAGHGPFDRESTLLAASNGPVKLVPSWLNKTISLEAWVKTNLLMLPPSGWEKVLESLHWVHSPPLAARALARGALDTPLLAAGCFIADSGQAFGFAMTLKVNEVVAPAESTTMTL